MQDTLLSTSQILAGILVMKTQGNRCYYHSYFRNEETEAQAKL